MDNHLATILTDQMAQGNKCDGDTWKAQALHAAVTYLNSKLHLNLTKDNIKNRLKIWKKSFNVVSDIQTKQSGFTWDEVRKLIVVTSDEWSSWNSYVESHPDAKGMQNKMIENWDDIILLCGKDRATGQGAETFDEGVEAIGEEDEIEVTSAPISGSRVRPSSSTDSMNDKKKRPKKDSLAEVVSAIATSFQEFLASKRKGEEKSSGIEMHDVVSMIPGLTDDEVFKAVRMLMNGNEEEFNLLKALPDEKKKDWIYFLIYS
ncbi:PREDICTED: uncharacterized protein LOC105963495 [Erythranthe guttata]|uniref:uncharacterized protein LOC105963495 n=1 Tax=Erythranthe guttata TaxID=4155 RepID=UPI00064DDDC7|nr:PREDICTED: uncharacterized protein LOC105963495 [Erythranthe guttata]|eukprot:XP_012843355.1 PREDICTED: uncharacterized protein LOC105963495 [Erythranthe guttata]